MILAVAATEFELKPFRHALQGQPCRYLVGGVGPVESCLRLTRFLETRGADVTMIVNFGIAGAYLGNSAKQPHPGELCLAETDVLGDLGVCFPLRLDDMPKDLVLKKFHMDKDLLSAAGTILTEEGCLFHSGNFVTVSSVSGTTERGEILREKYDGLCENMEGAAIARVCQEYSLPMLQIRCVSNYVENRDMSSWIPEQAAEQCGKAAALLVTTLGKEYG